MTLWAILSDIHGNLEALEAVLADAAAQGAEKIAILGDTIDYGPNPLECLAHAAKADVWLVGNHEEEAVAASEEQEEDRGEARGAADSRRGEARARRAPREGHLIRPATVAEDVAGSGSDHAAGSVRFGPACGQVEAN